MEEPLTVSQSRHFCPNCHLTLDYVRCRTSPTGTEFVPLKLEAPKTDKFWKSQMLFAGHSKRSVCPVCCHQSLILRYDPAAHAYSTSPLFALKDGAALTRHGFLSFTSSRLRMLGIDQAHYNRHSFRIGEATSGANAGVPDYLIKTIGRWSSDCYQCYIRTPLDSVTSI